MAILKLYGAPYSTCTQRVAAVLKEKGVPYELIKIDLMKNEHKAPEFLEKQPFGQVPCIDDDGFKLFESRAICRYIATKYSKQGPNLIPTEPEANAFFEQGVSFEMSHFDPPASGLVYEAVVKKFFGGEADEAVAKAHTDKLAVKLDVYEKILTKQKYIGGDELTIADIFHLPYGSLAKRVRPELFSSRPHVAKWFAGIEARPSWIAVKDGVQ